MSTPTAVPAKGSRRSSRRPRNNVPSGGLHAENAVSDSGLSPPNSDFVAGNSATASAPQTINGEQARRKSQGAKKQSNTPKRERSPKHQHASSQPNPAQPAFRQATPVKQAYAGPTFHSSPAPSALPMPSFYSKSLPNVAAAKAPETVEEAEEQAETEIGVEEPIVAQKELASKRESTPLDFLFEAARQARATPRAGSPATQTAHLSSFGDSPLNRSPAPREGPSENVFPFELDGSGPPTNSIGPAFATPYKERLNALRSATASPSTTPPILDEDERKIKSEALKKLLMNAQAQSSRPTPGQVTTTNGNNPFNARAPEMRDARPSLHPVRPRSGPSTPVPSYHGYGSSQYFSTTPTAQYDPRGSESPVRRPVSSHLRRQYQLHNEDVDPVELSSDGAEQPTLISTARTTTRPPQHNSPALPRTGQAPKYHTTTHTAQQLENDLRKVLKLDLTSAS